MSYQLSARPVAYTCPALCIQHGAKYLTNLLFNVPQDVRRSGKEDGTQDASLKQGCTVRDFGGDSCVQITVPAAGSGVAPSAYEQQPFGRSGRINVYSAEFAVWWAFELTGEGEARAL
jgi:hypothetical protein